MTTTASIGTIDKAIALVNSTPLRRRRTRRRSNVIECDAAKDVLRKAILDDRKSLIVGSEGDLSVAAAKSLAKDGLVIYRYATRVAPARAVITRKALTSLK